MSKSKIRQFLGDKEMSDSVYEILLQSFLKKRDGDVYMKAGQRLAIDMFLEGWRDIENAKEEAKSKDEGLKQVGL